ncbi:uncharacterized protein TOT_010000769 [Theileria orientalis strain Shintoku]|uniref:C3H1-type domain-containing protein n=1 Tax=Theileria orientalis strain Shintoku TaxID=869250 RepID=J4D636_THEOR|nr:uncharacterized protein TOT_010000769 [Theileria orientalis strain Shintoku]PVC51975.1 hypothetical protein MACL_00001099 [Theileria orientalis]BAM39310.1 uncharacterized protein TOT_010000769 [Theileria orientalis strain Shintoku]|eukprot:XP_009689611.1 uncharacterized protein TOT_010000769 [Theileria orientalis strain Shintoku]
MPILSEEDLERFRTKVCTLASSLRCDFGVERCNYSHNLYWARRCPFYLRDSSILRYIPHVCPDVELGEGTTVLRNSCPRGNNCSFAHSYEEIHYHPLVYKTQVCKDYRIGKCKTYYCHLVHGLAEYRVPREYVLPRKAGLDIPLLPHVKLVDNIRSISTGNASVGCFQRGKSSIQSVDRSTRGEKDVVDYSNHKDWVPLRSNSGERKTEINGNAKSDGVNGLQKSSNGVTSKLVNGTTNGIAKVQNNSISSQVSKKNNEESLRSMKSLDAAEKQDESVYDWYKLIATTKVEYHDNENGINEMDKNYSILKIYDRQLQNSLNEFNQLNIYNNEISPYNGHYEDDLNCYETDKRNESLVRRNVNMWNDSSTKKIIESNNALGTVSSIIDSNNNGVSTVPSIVEDSYRSYDDVFQTSDLTSSMNSINGDEVYIKILKQCELIKKNTKPYVESKINWTQVINDCRKLLDIVIEAKKVSQEKSK